MLQEINNFMNSLPAELKQAGLKPKEGLHVLLKIQEKEGTHFMDEQSVCRVCLTRKATEFDYPFLQHCAELAQVGWCVNTNKCFDLPAKGLHSCSPYCIALKRESLEGGGKYAKKDGLENKETWAPCDPRYIDQLIGGWMRAGKDMVALKRRSPLSVSAMRPIHPLLGGLERDKENITFDRSDRPEWHPVNVRIEGSDRLMTKEEIEAYLQNNNRTLTKRIWIPDNTRATGLFVADMAIDLRALFCVTTNQHEPELSPEMITALEAEGWVKSKNVFGECLVMPKAEREKIIPVLANALINWRITSNQARTFSLMETLALAVSDNANHIAGAIRTKLIEEGDKPKAKLIIDETAGAEVFVTLPCASYVVTVNERATALEEAEKKLTDMMMAFDYENQ